MNIKMSIKIEELKKLPVEELSRKFKCLPEEICLGDYDARFTEDKECPYKVIMGHANFEGSHVTSLGKLEVVYGKRLQDGAGELHDIDGNPVYLGINLADSKITSLGNLEKVYGSITLNENIKSLGKVKYLGSNLFLGSTRLLDLGEHEIVEGMHNFERTQIQTLGKLKKVGKLRIGSTSLRNLGDLERVNKIIVAVQPRYRIDNMINQKLVYENGKYVKIKEEIKEQ